MFIPLDQPPQIPPIEAQIAAMRTSGTVPRLPDRPLPREQLEDDIRRANTLPDMAAAGVTSVFEGLRGAGQGRNEPEHPNTAAVRQEREQRRGLVQARATHNNQQRHQEGHRGTPMPSGAGREEGRAREAEDAQLRIQARSLGQAVHNYLGQLRDNLRGDAGDEESALFRRYEVLAQDNSELCMVQGALALNRHKQRSACRTHGVV